MKYVIDDVIVAKSELNLPELFALLLVKTGANVKEVLDGLAKKEAIVEQTVGKYLITQRWSDMSDNILLSSENTIPTDEELIHLAEKLMQILPQGKKPGTPYYWKCNKREVALKLKSFFKLYGAQYTEEEIISAAYRYVESFNGDYRYMRLLKYFIWKKENGEEISELATYIDNDGQEDSDYGESWVNELK